MSSLTSVERISRQLRRLPVDRIGAMESFWSFTIANWVKQGKMPAGVSAVEHFDFDFESISPFKLMINPDHVDQVLAEDEDTITVLDSNGATMRRHKKHASTPEHLDYAIKNRADWLERAKPFLTPGSHRLRTDSYNLVRDRARQAQRFFCWGGVNVFEAIHPIAGHEHMLMGMALDPDWVKDMADTYADLLIGLFEELFAQCGKPDGIWFFEDMGFRGRPFMSPAMYREMIFPAHRRTIDFLHGHKLPVIMHSCGFVEPFLPDMIEAGIDCLQAIEIKAGMDVLRIQQQFGDKITLMGGLDVRPVANNDLPAIKRELESKIPLLKAGHNFIFHSDHSIPESTEYETYTYFLQLGRELGVYE